MNQPQGGGGLDTYRYCKRQKKYIETWRYCKGFIEERKKKHQLTTGPFQWPPTEASPTPQGPASHSHPASHRGGNIFNFGKESWHHLWGRQHMERPATVWWLYCTDTGRNKDSRPPTYIKLNQKNQFGLYTSLSQMCSQTVHTNIL